MAIIMSKNNSWVILSSILGDTQPYQKAKYLQSIGADVKVGLFAVTITVNGKEFSETMPVSLSMVAQSDTQVQTLVKAKIAALVEKALIHSAGPALAGSVAAATQTTTAIPNPAATPAWMSNIPVPEKEIKAAQSVAGTVSNTGVSPVNPVPATGFDAWAAVNAPVAPVKAKPTANVVSLKDARALSQKVHGTSSGSVYRVAAVGKVNVAIREQQGTVSVRAEFQTKADTATVSKLTALGFTEGKGYLSMHISLTGNAPAMRVVGSILLGAGIEFEQVATTAEQING